ncbi:protease modulator HflC [Gilvimarinus sp. F26214L]|uniref:protease modulator HflC n=1 Tax=Gilvimarinus sp. DZF01 TaxID=3461371 RepID=UPI004045EB1E
MNTKSVIALALLGAVALLAVNSLYIVQQTEKAVLLEWGRMAQADIKPGLHVKVPIMNRVQKFDARILTSATTEQRFLTVEKKGMMVDYFAKWRIADVGRYYVATNGDESRADQLIAQRVNAGLRNEFGERTLQEVVSGERDELMSALIDTLSQFSEESLGVEIIDVRVKRIDLPADVSDSVFQRMTAERQQEAQEHRSKGKEQAEVIRADADRQKTIIEAEAYRDAEQIRGEGDALAAAIYAEAYNKDSEFYQFVRSLNAYRETFSSRNDVLLVDPSSEFFRYLNSPTGTSDQQ